MHRQSVLDWDLGQKWAAWRAAHPGSSLRDDALELGVSEAELVATECGASALRLQGGWVELLRGLQEIGPVAVEAESSAGLLEARGVVVPVGWSGRVGVLRVGNTRLRVELDRCWHGFAADEADGRSAIHLFTDDGRPLLAIRTDRESMTDRWRGLVRRFASADQRPWTEPAARRAARPADGAVDVATLRSAWDREATDAMRATLRRLGVPRGQAVRLAGTPRAQQVTVDSFAAAVHAAATAMLPLALSIETPGAVATFRGRVARVELRDDVLLVIEPGFRLFAHQPRIASGWVVRRPGPTGPVTSLQYFDDHDEPVLVVCAHVAPGEPGIERWDRLVASLR